MKFWTKTNFKLWWNEDHWVIADLSHCVPRHLCMFCVPDKNQDGHQIWDRCSIKCCHCLIYTPNLLEGRCLTDVWSSDVISAPVFQMRWPSSSFTWKLWATKINQTTGTSKRCCPTPSLDILISPCLEDPQGSQAMRCSRPPEGTRWVHDKARAECKTTHMQDLPLKRH